MRPYFKSLPWMAVLVFVTLFALAGADEAEARRAGGGASLGSRGSRTVAAPKAAPTQQQRSTVAPQQQTTATPATPATPAMAPSRGMMGGIGGFLLGGLLGGMLFGGLSGMGIGLFDILLIGGGIWFVLRLLRQRRAQESGYFQAAGTPYLSREGVDPSFDPEPVSKIRLDKPATASYSGFGINDDNAAADLERGLSLIATMDPSFNEARFLEGAQIAFERIQHAWSVWNMERLQPLLTEHMLQIAQQQARELQHDGERTVVDRIRFRTSEVSEAWQESGEDWITIHFVAEMVDYMVDGSGRVIEGDAETPVSVEEYWTFTRATGSPDPNWKLAAIQQPGETVRR